MVSTIQVSNDLMESLRQRKMYDKESYEDIIWDLMEDSMELSEETRKNISKSTAEVAAGKTVPIDKVKKKLGL